MRAVVPAEPDPPATPAPVVHRREPRWPATLAIVAALGLYLALPSTLVLGPRWILPVLEVALIIPVSLTDPDLPGVRSACRNSSCTVAPKALK